MELKNSYLFFIIFTLLFACKKDKDTTKPSISIIAPVYLQQINGLDTIQVLAAISDDRNIESVSVSLRNSNDIPILSTATKNPNTTNYNLNIPYFFNDIHLASGQYYFDVSAFDGENYTHEYVTISFNEATKIRKGIFVSSNTASSSDVYSLDNNFNGNLYKTITGDYIGAAVNSYHQQFIYASSITGGISAIDLNSGSNLWNVPIITSPPTPYYLGFLYNNHSIFMGKRNGGIQGYDNNGSANYSAQADVGYYMESALVHENNYLVTEQKLVAGSAVRLVLYWMASGAKVQEVALSGDVKGIYSQTSNTIILLTNDASSLGKLLFYDIITGLTSSPFNINVGHIDDCLEISAGVYLVANNGDITLVNANNFSTLPYLTGIGVSRLWYDNLANELFVGNGNSLTVYDYSSKNLKGSYVHPSTIQEVVFWYNK